MTSTTTTTAPAADLAPLRVGLVATNAGPIGGRDSHAIEVLTASAEVFATDREVIVEILRVAAADDIDRVIEQMTNAGVTVVFTTCDGTLTQDIVEHVADAGLLAVTSCAALPASPLTPGSRNVIDLASLSDHAQVLADHLSDIGVSAPAFLRSTLVGDVERSCLDTERRLAATHAVRSVASASFGGIVEGADDVILTNAAELVAADAFVVCALPGALGEAIDTIRTAGFAQPVYVPWFGSSERFADTTTDVFILAPASVFGDDPSADLKAVFARLTSGEEDAADAVIADAFVSVIQAAAASGSIGSGAIERQLLVQAEAATGVLTIDADTRRPINRNYRVIEMRGATGSVVDITSTGS
ncbi:MAG: hypothetical protein HKN94_14790 [Acidimicrobiales bacterium]|nr:hypothetical protein [Acidimicrobiales bacterium]RZV48064.1 MAG: hypothetical protein EX269_03065 [Acidimicrobiales bacterium]